MYGDRAVRIREPGFSHGHPFNPKRIDLAGLVKEVEFRSGELTGNPVIQKTLTCGAWKAIDIELSDWLLRQSKKYKRG